MRSCQLLVASALLLTAATLRAEEPTVPEFLVRPVTTDYQRSQLPTNPSVVAIVHGAPLLDETTVREDSAHARQLRKELQEVAKRSNTRLYVILRMTHETFDDPDRWKKLDAAVRSWANDAGFQNVDVTRHGTSSSWSKQLSGILAAPDEGVDAIEPVVQNSLVRVSPIKTALSRFLGGNTDCVVEIRHPFDGRFQEVPDVLKSSIHEAVAEARPSRREKLQFHLTSTEAGRSVIERAFASGGSDAPINQLAREFGFETADYRHSPCGGAPESLINQPAPDFTLERLEGGELTLSEVIRGKPAFVSFWGVACGPCRREAPHLTALHRKFADQGFVIVAVNAYDEKREAVQAFVEKNSLSHPIVLMGQKAADKYCVGAYPTGFWVDHTGRVIGYTLDFLPGEEVEMAERMAAMLKAAK